MVLALLSVAAPGHSQTPEPPATEASGAGENIAWPTEGWQIRPLDEDTRSRPAFQELESYLSRRTSTSRREAACAPMASW